MAEYIEREPMIEEMQRLIDNVSRSFPKATETDLIILKGKYEAFMEYIKEQPAADVQPVIHAKWILFDRDSVGRAFYCSNCRKVTTTDDYEDTPLDRDEYFCMRCGADMRSPDATKG